ncbi:hypothetical protein SISNIDRAFT_419206 [Sistotremastrum niveocremeum HHB9708]|uniref:Tat pathway signal sequence n=1 Tax=Sistotremastrum niveocremeum HHB9708 TaxID=1314777 RepID=A0A164NHK8_9AGAM|nr:hypothetical protein SISNIDRAFT_419206 [Sistotremastrum niveocremeum HHB9708]
MAAPAQGAIRNEIRVFSHALALSQYHGPPTDESDEAWESLYRIGISRISRDQASLLPNWTEAIPGDEDHYAVALDVFHQLHCLNLIRKALLPKRYGPSDPIVHTTDPAGNAVAFDHVDHCINSVRESLMCNADIAVNVWQWDPKKMVSAPRLDNLHVCKNWDDIYEWANQHKITSGFNTSRHAE